MLTVVRRISGLRCVEVTSNAAVAKAFVKFLSPVYDTVTV